MKKNIVLSTIGLLSVLLCLTACEEPAPVKTPEAGEANITSIEFRLASDKKATPTIYIANNFVNKKDTVTIADNMDSDTAIITEIVLSEGATSSIKVGDTIFNNQITIPVTAKNTNTPVDFMLTIQNNTQPSSPGEANITSIKFKLASDKKTTPTIYTANNFVNKKDTVIVTDNLDSDTAIITEIVLSEGATSSIKVGDTIFNNQITIPVTAKNTKTPVDFVLVIQNNTQPSSPGEANITSIKFKLASDKKTTPTIYNANSFVNQTSTVTITDNLDSDTAIITEIVLSEGATSSIKVGDTIFNNKITIPVTAKNTKTPVNFMLTIQNNTPGEANITSIKFKLASDKKTAPTIYTANSFVNQTSTVTITDNMDSDTAIITEIVLSEGATSSIKVGDTIFNNQITIPVTAKNTKTPVNFMLTIQNNTPGTADITSIKFKLASDKKTTPTIYTANNFVNETSTAIITDNLDSDTAIITEIVLSEGATSSIKVGDTIFNNQITIPVTAKNTKTPVEFTLTIQNNTVGLDVTSFKIELTVQGTAEEYTVDFSSTTNASLKVHPLATISNGKITAITVSSGATASISLDDNISSFPLNFTVSAQGNTKNYTLNVAHDVIDFSNVKFATIPYGQVSEVEVPTTFSNRTASIELPASAQTDRINLKDYTLSTNASTTISKGTSLPITGNAVSIEVRWKSSTVAIPYTVNISQKLGIKLLVLDIAGTRDTVYFAEGPHYNINTLTSSSTSRTVAAIEVTNGGRAYFNGNEVGVGNSVGNFWDPTVILKVSKNGGDTIPYVMVADNPSVTTLTTTVYLTDLPKGTNLAVLIDGAWGEYQMTSLGNGDFIQTLTSFTRTDTGIYFMGIGGTKADFWKTNPIVIEREPAAPAPNNCMNNKRDTFHPNKGSTRFIKFDGTEPKRQIVINRWGRCN